jgi:hypothetical protein
LKLRRDPEQTFTRSQNEIASGHQVFPKNIDDIGLLFRPLINQDDSTQNQVKLAEVLEGLQQIPLLETETGTQPAGNAPMFIRFRGEVLMKQRRRQTPQHFELRVTPLARPRERALRDIRTEDISIRQPPTQRQFGELDRHRVRFLPGTGRCRPDPQFLELRLGLQNGRDDSFFNS